MISTWVFGQLVFDPNDRVWLGFVRLPAFEPSESSEPAPAEGVDEILARIETRSRKLEQTDDPPPTAQQEFENWRDDRPNRRDVLARNLDRWIDKLKRVRRAEGLRCVKLTAEDGGSPRPIQEDTVRLLLANGPAIRDAVYAALARSCEVYETDAVLAARAKLGTITVHDDGLDGVAPIVFGIDCDWEHEHGIEVAYHPRIGADWACSCESDLSAALPEPPPLPPPTPEEQLIGAIYAGDEERIHVLLAQGVRADGIAWYPAIAERNVETVRRLLAAGADPNHRDDYEGTPLEAARRALAEVTLTLPRAPWWMRMVMVLPRVVFAGNVWGGGRSGRAVIRLLIEAAAR